MIKIEADKRGNFRIFPSEKPSPSHIWLTRLTKDPLLTSIESERSLLQQVSEDPEVNEDWRQYAEEEILITAMKWRQEFCPRPGVLKFSRSNISHLAAFLNRSRLKVSELAKSPTSVAGADSDLEEFYEFLTFVLEVVVNLEHEFSA
jgi:hypothetical protein